VISVIYGELEGGAKKGDGDHVPDSVSKYLNRLSDYFFTASRYVNWVEGKDEVLYCRPKRTYKNKTSGSKKIEIKCKGEEKKEGVDSDSKESMARRRRDRRRRIVIAQKEGTLK